MNTAATLVVAFAALTTPSAAVAQSRQGLLAGLASNDARYEVSGSLTDAPTARARDVAHIADSTQTHGNWKVGAFVGGLIGLALESLYHSAVTDDQHATRETVELTLGGAVIGSLIAAH